MITQSKVLKKIASAAQLLYRPLLVRLRLIKTKTKISLPSDGKLCMNKIINLRTSVINGKI